MIARTPELKAVLQDGDVLKLTTDVFNDSGQTKRVDKYLLVLVYNHFADSKIREDTFVKKRCVPSLSADEIVACRNAATKKIQELEQLEQALAVNPELDYQNIASIIRARHHIVSWMGEIYKYVDGVYILDKEGIIDSEIITELMKNDDFKKDDKVTQAAQQVKHYIRFEKPEPEYPFNKIRGMFNVANGVVKINLDTGDHELLPHNPEFRFNYKLLVEYNAEAPIEPILKYIESLGDDVKDILIQIPAHCLLSMDRQIFKKAYFLKGGEDCGKSTYTQMLAECFFGMSVCCSLSLQELLYDRFKRANLEGKLLNYRGDLPSAKISDAGTFKNLTGGDGVSIEKKGVQSTDNFINRAVFVFSANNYPKITVPDDGGVFWNRWIAVPMNNRFEKDPLFATKTFTKENMSGLLNVVLMAIPSILKDGLKTTPVNIMDDWLRDSDSSYEFIKTHLEKCPGAVLVKGSIYQDYVNWCVENELTSVDIRVFSKTMGGKPFAYRTDSQHKVGGRSGQHCFTDCKRVNEFAIYPDGYQAPAKNAVCNQTALR